MTRLLAVASLAASLAACAAGPIVTARDQFTEDSTCPTDRVVVERAPASAGKADPTYVARGCGFEKTYVCKPAGDSDFKCVAM